MWITVKNAAICCHQAWSGDFAAFFCMMSSMLMLWAYCMLMIRGADNMFPWSCLTWHWWCCSTHRQQGLLNFSVQKVPSSRCFDRIVNFKAELHKTSTMELDVEEISLEWNGPTASVLIICLSLHWLVNKWAIPSGPCHTRIILLSFCFVHWKIV